MPLRGENHVRTPLPYHPDKTGKHVARASGREIDNLHVRRNLVQKRPGFLHQGQRRGKAGAIQMPQQGNEYALGAAADQRRRDKKDFDPGLGHATVAS